MYYLSVSWISSIRLNLSKALDGSAAGGCRQRKLGAFRLPFEEMYESIPRLGQMYSFPSPRPELSVTRHFGLDDGEIWEKGEVVGRERSLPLIGRGDVVTEEFRRQQLMVSAAPIPGNVHHANVTGWPLNKAAQKHLAQEISSVARFIKKPV